MQHRMKEFKMSEEAILNLLNRAQVGRISTISSNGYPYTVAVHYIYMNGKVYFHGLPKGEKIENIKNNPRVCFEIDELTGYLLDGLDSPCKADTEYESVVIKGRAYIVDAVPTKINVLEAIISKYASEISNMPIGDNMLKGTAVVEITIEEVTGKYHL